MLQTQKIQTSSTSIAVIGASGAIGSSLVKSLSKQSGTNILALARSKTSFSGENISSHFIDIENEITIANAAALAERVAPLDTVIVATGFLHDHSIMPEKSLNELTAEKFHTLFAVNTIGPALVAKHFLPLLNKQRKSIFAVMSARVGSISDNHLGGWYAYRSSKAALNMVIKTTSIEMKRRNKNAIIIGLHPGTVASPLSEPFQNNVPEKKLFAADYAATQLINVLKGVTAQDSGKLIAWDNREVGF